MEHIPARSDYIGNPHELVAEHCPYCDSVLVECYPYIQNHIMVCGNPECDDCDPKLYAAHMAELAEMETTK